MSVAEAVRTQSEVNLTSQYTEQLERIHSLGLRLHDGDLTDKFYLPSTGPDNQSDMRLSHVELECPRGVAMEGHTLLLDPEYRQPSGAFKAHGARAAVLDIVSSLPSDTNTPHRIVTGSAGNAANALAVMAKEFGLGSTSYVPDHVSSEKSVALVTNGSKVILAGPNVASAVIKARKAGQKRKNTHFVHPNADERVFAGQETIALDTLDSLERKGYDLRQATIYITVPVGGGSNLVGYATALYNARRDGRVGNNVKLFAVEVQDTDGDSVRDKSSPELSWCDGTNADTSELARWVQNNPDYCDSTVYVQPHEVAEAMHLLTGFAHQRVEPAGALGTAAAKQLASQLERPGNTVGWRAEVVTFVTQITGAKISKKNYDEIMKFRVDRQRVALEQLARIAWGDTVNEEPSDALADEILYGCVRAAMHRA